MMERQRAIESKLRFAFGTPKQKCGRNVLQTDQLRVFAYNFTNRPQKSARRRPVHPQSVSPTCCRFENDFGGLSSDVTHLHFFSQLTAPCPIRSFIGIAIYPSLPHSAEIGD